MALKPLAIAQADYSIAQNPVLGGEIEVWATTEPSFNVKSVRCLVPATTYEVTTYKAPGSGIQVAVVGSRGLTGALTTSADGAVIEVPLWAVNKATRFPTGKAAEGAIPTTGANGTSFYFGARGEVMDQIEIPDYDPTANPAIWYNVGCTTERRLKLPTRMSKAIACQMESSKFVVPGKTEIGELSVTAYNQGHEEGLLKIAGLKTTVMLRVFKESVLEVARIFIIDWTPTIERTDPAGEAESTVQASGLFSKFAAISADGTP